MSAPSFHVVSIDDDDLSNAHVLALPDVSLGTSVRLERTEDGWVNRGVLSPLYGWEYPVVWVSAPSTETNE